jgi:hypothetical protein
VIQNGYFKIWKRNKTAWKRSEEIQFEVKDTTKKIRIRELLVVKNKKGLAVFKIPLRGTLKNLKK